MATEQSSVKRFSTQRFFKVPAGRTQDFRDELKTSLCWLKPSMEYRLDTLMDWLRGFLNDGRLTGTWRLRYQGNDQQYRLDCGFAGGVLEDEFWPDHQTLFESVLVDTIPVEIVREPDGGIYLASTLFNSCPYSAREWGNWREAKTDTCGDRWDYWSFREAEVFVVSDGLGTGPEAARASRQVARTIETTGDGSVVELIEQIHHDLQSTRGAVLFLGRLPRGTNRLEYCSVGNVEARILGDEISKSLFSFNGTPGYELPEIETYSESLEGVDRMILHTDGVNAPDPGFFDGTFLESGPLMNSLRLLESFRLENDDALVSVVDC